MQNLLLKVTYLDNNTATFTLPDARFDNGLADGANFRLYNGGAQDIEVTFVRLIWRNNPVIFAHGFEP